MAGRAAKAATKVGKKSSGFFIFFSASAYLHAEYHAAGDNASTYMHEPEDDAVVSSKVLTELASGSNLTGAAVLLKPVGVGAWAAAGDPDAFIYPASMLKTPLALAALTLGAEGAISGEAHYTVTPANMTANDEDSPLEPGYEASLEELAELAVTRSDNVATNMLFDIAGRERAGALCRERFGLRDTAFHRKLSGADPLIDDPGWDGVHRNRHSARDAALLFDAVAGRRVPFAGVLCGFLARQHWNTKLSLGLRPGDAFAHKTGDTGEVTHDGGILELGDGRSFVLVAYTQMPSTDENNARFGEFMQRLLAVL